jgi:cell division septation protein DedD
VPHSALEFEGDDMRRNALIVAMTLASVLALTTLTGCSREKIDWKSAEAADTVEGYDHFLERHPDGALATQARTRVAQLNEDRDWKKATAVDTADAYRQFLAQHDSGKWAEEARIRVENFSLDGTASGPGKPVADAAPAVAATPAAAPAAAVTPAPTHGPKEAQMPPAAPHPAAASPTKPTSEPKRVAAAVPSAPAAAPSAAPPPSGQFGIQLGAFHSQDAALKNWKQLQAKYDSDLHGLFAHAVPLKQTSGGLFRLQAPVGEETRARAICASLAKQSQPCVVVLPQP